MRLLRRWFLLLVLGVCHVRATLWSSINSHDFLRTVSYALSHRLFVIPAARIVDHHVVEAAVDYLVLLHIWCFARTGVSLLCHIACPFLVSSTCCLVIRVDWVLTRVWCSLSLTSWAIPTVNSRSDFLKVVWILLVLTNIATYRVWLVLLKLVWLLLSAITTISPLWNSGRGNFRFFFNWNCRGEIFLWKSGARAKLNVYLISIWWLLVLRRDHV